MLLPANDRNNGPVSAPLRLCYLPQTDSYTFDVWRVPAVTLKWPHARQQLSGLAEEHVRAWTNEGGVVVGVRVSNCTRLIATSIISTKIALQITAKLGKPSANLKPDATKTTYSECDRQGETISTAFVESTNTYVVSWRFVKQQQMHWTRRGAHLLLQTRTTVLNDKLEGVFRRWYPLFRVHANAACPPSSCCSRIYALLRRNPG